MHILVTGFEPFGNDSFNASVEVTNRLPQEIFGHRISTLILPVSFARSTQTLKAAIADNRPDLVLCLGETGGHDAITPELWGVNLDDARIPDNDGAQPKNTPIEPAAPQRARATVDPEPITAKLLEAGYRAHTSEDAGRFVCNHLAFTAYRQEVPALFIHVPAVRPPGIRASVGSETDSTPMDSDWDLPGLALAIEVAIATL